jgi:hypothetical protein
MEHYEGAAAAGPGSAGSEFGPPGDLRRLAEKMAMSERSWTGRVIEAASAAARRRPRLPRISRQTCPAVLCRAPPSRARLLGLLDREPMLGVRGDGPENHPKPAEYRRARRRLRTVDGPLRGRGMRLCIDDFGAGAAAFRYLRAFRVDLVKIDGGYLRNAMRSEQDRGILASMVGLIRTVGARSVSERIETEDEAGLMSGLGVELGQGWLFGRPGALPS